jgi:programmed cell death 6-interacting protein
VYSRDDRSTLQALSLPAALDALDKPIGLPPSLLKKAEEVRLEDGPHRIDVMSRDMQALAASARGLLEQVISSLLEAYKFSHHSRAWTS